jgi:hypothetical protein
MLKARASKKPSWPRASVPDGFLLYLDYCKYRRRLNAHEWTLALQVRADSPPKSELPGSETGTQEDSDRD